MNVSRVSLAWVLALLPLVAVPACVGSRAVAIGSDCRDGFCNEGPTFTPPDSGEREASSPGLPLLACVGTDCPSGYATCTATHQCGTDLNDDPENCGACGKSCNEFLDAHMGGKCVNGACVYTCLARGAAVFRDCNGVLDDGCEADIFNDRAHCGACGDACPSGQRCRRGACGCASPKLDCGEAACTDPLFDDKHCKTCGNACQPPAAACSPMPPNTRYGCMGGECGQLKCTMGFADCDNDLEKGCASNGCEVSVTDRNNCGGCGVVCGPDQECKPNAFDGLECQDTCAKQGGTDCFDSGCVDLLTDVRHCGSCSVECSRWNEANTAWTCDKGMCVAACEPGFADCNRDRSDGCEVDLRADPTNCGACGNWCDVGAGQPCIDGKCLMTECDGGVVAK